MQDSAPVGLSGRRQRGFTLIEMIVVIALLGIAVSAAVITLSNTRRSNLRSAAGKMAAMARYLYNRSILDARPYRLVIDMDEGVFWGEVMTSDDPCAAYVPSPDAEEREEERRRQEKKRERQARGKSFDKSEEEIAEELERSVASAFSGLRDQMLKPRKIPAQIMVSGIMTAHHDVRQNEGRAAVHFWPSGRAERTLIWWAMRSTDDDAVDGYLTVLTLEVEGLTGRVKRHQYELSDEFLKRQIRL